MVRVLLLSSLSPSTGNNVTANRIADFLREDENITLVECRHASSDSNASITDWQRFDCCIGLHAFRAGRLLLDCPLPFALIFGGTDINENIHDIAKHKIMTDALTRSNFIVAFRPSLIEKAINVWGGVIDEHKYKLIAPSIKDPAIDREAGFSIDMAETIRECLKRKKKNEEAEESKLISKPNVFILPCGLRPVKDVLFLTQAFSEWHSKHSPHSFFLIIGPSLDPVYSQTVFEQIENLEGVLYSPSVEQNLLHELMAQSTAVINSSLSEGLSNVVLESMMLKVPLIVKNIEGNASLVHHRKTGFLYDDPQQFVQLAEELSNDKSLSDSIAQAAFEYANQHHSVAQERHLYQQLVRDLLAS